MRRHDDSSFGSRRSGAAALECAIVLPVALFVLFAILDLGLAAIRYNALAECARRMARQAIIRGSLAPSEHWGPTEFVGTAADDSPIAQAISGELPTMMPQKVLVHVTWLDGDNGPHDRVRVELTFHQKSLVPVMTAWHAIDLRASTTMCIVN
jgi:Flp pilus assembly protein TadG